MRRNINKLASKHIDNFLQREGRMKVERKDGYSVVSYDLFEHLDDRKKVIAFLKSELHDVFKRGTKEPRAIEITLSNTGWDNVKDLDPKDAHVIGMFD